jgi:hypothetical protein
MSLYRVDEVLLEHRRRTDEMDRRWLTAGQPQVRRTRVGRRPRRMPGAGFWRVGFRRARA